MTPGQLEEAFRQTLEDRKLSRSERRALSQVIEEAGWTKQQRDVARGLAFDAAREAMTNDLAPVQALDWLEETLKMLRADDRQKPVRSDACFSPGEACRERIRSLFRHARRTADVCVFTITDNRITESIVEAHQRGLQIRIVTDDEKSFDLGSDIDILARSGIAVRVDRTRHHMHHKFAVFDNETILTGSYNWTVSAVRHNEENLIVSDDPGLVRDFSAAFEDLWTRFA